MFALAVNMRNFMILQLALSSVYAQERTRNPTTPSTRPSSRRGQRISKKAAPQLQPKRPLKRDGDNESGPPRKRTRTTAEFEGEIDPRIAEALERFSVQPRRGQMLSNFMQMVGSNLNSDTQEIVMLQHLITFVRDVLSDPTFDDVDIDVSKLYT